MSKLIFVKSVEGREVFIHGTTTIVPSDGIEVEDSSYWQRRLNDGDVELATKPKTAKADKEQP